MPDMREAWGHRSAGTVDRDQALPSLPALTTVRHARRSPEPPERGTLAVVGQRQPSGQVGRDGAVGVARTYLLAGTSVLVVGPPGIGKSTVLATLADAVPGARVLRAAAAEVESGLPYLTLVDLFGAALGEQGSLLPGHLRAALDAALLRTVAPTTPQDELAVRLAVLELVRILAAQTPVLLVIDDLQWVDEPSAGVLHFVARRLAGLPVQVLAAERTEHGPLRTHLCPEPYVELPLRPLDREAVADVLRERFGTVLSPAAVDRIHAASGGNPLFAVELGRALVERGEPGDALEPLPVPDRLRSLLSARLAALPPAAGLALTVLAAAARPTRALLERCGLDAGAHLAEAFAAGVVTGGTGGALAFSHPLLREMVYADSDPAIRRAAHEKLAGALDDPVERARHLAVVRPEPNEALAVTLTDAAAVARRRGAPVVAADLARLAAERTPDPGWAADRRLVAARHAYASGLSEEARRLAEDALREASDPATRVGARLLLVDLAGQDQSAVGPVLEPGAQGVLRRGHRVGAGRAQARRTGGRAGRRHRVPGRSARLAGQHRVGVPGRGGRGTDGAGRDAVARAAAVLRRGHRPADGRHGPGDAGRRRRGGTPGRSAAGRGRTRRYRPGPVHRAGLGRLGVLAGRPVRRCPGRRPVLRPALRRHRLRGTRAGAGRRGVRRARRRYRRAGRRVRRPGGGRLPRRRGRGLAQAGVRRPGPGTAAVRRTGRRPGADAPGVRPGAAARADRPGAAGVARRLRGGPGAGRLPGRGGRGAGRDRGPGPAAGTGRRGARAGPGGGAVCSREIGGQARRLERDVVVLGLARAAALCAAVGGAPREGARDLSDALTIWADHPYPFEVARAWHVLSGIERRAHRRGAAREALLEAISRYTACGAAPWRATAEAELARLDGARTGGLSDSERRIVELVRQGSTNREIARSTYLS
ncbi:MAG: hypothetical protein E6G35_06085, partial [Actinobacteria bacterium]